MPFDNIVIRRPTEADYAVMAKILVDGWHSAYKNIVEEEYLNTLTVEQTHKRYIENKKGNAFLVAEVNGEVAAFCRYSLNIPAEEQNGFDGTISEIYVKPELKHSGIGTVLFKNVLQDFRTNGNSCVILGCFSENKPSLSFYEKMGGEFMYEQDLEIGGAAYQTTFYRFDLKKHLNIRKAKAGDAEALKVLYFEHLTKYPPQEVQDMWQWERLLSKFEEDENMYLLVLEENGKVVASVQMAIIESLTHNVRPFAIIENVVTHAEYRNRGYASALLEMATEIAKEKRCYKMSLETGSNRESTLNFYRKNGFEIDKKHSCLKRL